MIERQKPTHPPGALENGGAASSCSSPPLSRIFKCMQLNVVEKTNLRRNHLLQASNVDTSPVRLGTTRRLSKDIPRRNALTKHRVDHPLRETEEGQLQPNAKPSEDGTKTHGFSWMKAFMPMTKESRWVKVRLQKVVC